MDNKHKINLIKVDQYLEEFGAINLLRWIKKNFNSIQSFSVGNAKRATFRRCSTEIKFYINCNYKGSLYDSGYFRPSISNDKTFGCKIGKYLNKKMRDDSIKNILD
jgi:hypothetical protein